MPRNALAAAGVFEPDPTNPLAAPPSLADAWDVTGSALRRNAADTWAAMRDPQTWQDAADQYRSAMLMGSVAPEAKGLGLDAQAMKVLRDMTPGFRAYHGSPHSFDQFSSDKIGTGEGAQAYGHGLYLADSEGVARSYRDALSNPTYDGGPYNSADPAHRAAFYLGRFGGDRTATLAAIDAEDKQLATKISGLQKAYPNVTDPTVLSGIAGPYQDARTRLAGTKAYLADQKQPIPEVKSSGHMYEVNVASDPAHFLDWDKPRDQLAPNVQAFAKEHYPGAWENAADGSSLYHGMAQNVMRERTVLQTMLDNKRLDGDMREFPTERAQLDAMANPYAYVSQRLQEAGIPGIRYLDGGSRAGGQGTRNHVIFDPATIAILRKYGLAGLMAGGGAAAGVNAGNSE